MRPRDIALVGAVVAIAGFAAADALRGDGDPRARTGSARGATSTAGIGEDAGGLTPIPAKGSLVVAGGTNCLIRELRVATAAEMPAARIETACRISAAPVDRFVAFERGAAFGVFEVAHLGDPSRRRRLEAFTRGDFVWSPDGRRVAWCDPFSRSGSEVVFPAGKIRQFSRCPLAYVSPSEPAFAHGRSLVVAGRRILTAGGRITAASFGRDGSVAVVAGGRIERWLDGRRRRVRELPRGLLAGREYGASAAAPLFSPDNCEALFELRSEVRLVEVGCYVGRDDRSFDGTAAAWSPEGDWIAIGGGDGVAFYHLLATDEVARWPIDAQDLAWR